ncbi:uncharacterized protein BDZ99DRAFT_458663 [Mytilinidion resinicola]|uniref:Uncharacterized protein n=1 Tax=Mytilinidion resinicola TaxID=574789 RepID=A0A6A6Z348_9PEZI|nr:uncharacterized protein BDZ99DRAFT_458663 [Mytilinidion resinicola]KAF2814667.1 hypothetical protein BDZ99DRAFT_458663 [Mytilinidion resinicola]
MARVMVLWCELAESGAGEALSPRLPSRPRTLHSALSSRATCRNWPGCGNTKSCPISRIGVPSCGWAVLLPSRIWADDSEVENSSSRQHAAFK